MCTRAKIVNAVSSILAVVLGGSVLLSAAEAQVAASCTVPAIDARQVCAVENVILARDGTPIDYDGKTYWMCCPRCVDAFKGNPDAARLATDPVNGEKVDKATALIQPYGGRVFFFTSEATRTAFLSEPERWLH
jgi:YHS domain-containing protein